jgi:hypothetical protein
MHMHMHMHMLMATPHTARTTRAAHLLVCVLVLKQQADGGRLARNQLRQALVEVPVQSECDE